MNYFIEGLQGAGKSTLLDRLAEHFPDAPVYREGDYCPVELAWCALLSQEDYAAILARYPDLEDGIRKNTVMENGKPILMYTQLRTEQRAFYEDCERFEIYNGQLSAEAFTKLVLSRYRAYAQTDGLFECALLQNILENLMLYLVFTDEEILAFYRRVRDALKDVPFTVLYLDTETVKENLETARRERVDADGNEVWFGLMTAYLEQSPYGKRSGLRGMELLLSHALRRRALEKRILAEVFPAQSRILKSKAYTMDEILREE